MAANNQPDYLGSCASTRRLPDEILMIVLDSGLTTRDLARFALTCRCNNDFTTPVLYKKHLQEEDGSAVLWAVFRNSLGTLKTFIANGLDINRIWEDAGQWLLGNFNATAWRSEFPSRFPSREFDFLPVAFAAALGLDGMVTFLLDNGATIDTPLWGLCEVSEMPIRHRFAPGPPFNGYFKVAAHKRSESYVVGMAWTPLHHAIHWSHASTAKLLISRGAHPGQLCHRPR